MHNRMHRDALAIWLVAMALATGAAAAEPEQPDDELAEVVVTGRRAADAIVQQNPQMHFNWLARLVGEFTVEGYVDVSPRAGTRDLLTAAGRIKCIGFGVAPGVLCDLNIRWPRKTAADGKEIPGTAPTLDPATLLFGFKENGYNYELGGFEVSEYAIKHVLVDNRGVFESGHGVHDGEDTVVSRSHCAAVRADCERLVRITASPDARTVDLLIELDIEGHKAVRHVLLMSRVPGTDAEVYGREPAKKERSK